VRSRHGIRVPLGLPVAGQVWAMIRRPRNRAKTSLPAWAPEHYRPALAAELGISTAYLELLLARATGPVGRDLPAAWLWAGRP
jgi:hypothetical protein